MTYTLEELLSKDDHELDAIAAEVVMGWKHIGDDEPFSFHITESGVITSSGPAMFSGFGGVIPYKWTPSTSIADAFTLQSKLQERSLEKQFGSILFDICGAGQTHVPNLSFFRLANADARSRVIASILTAQADDGEKQGE